MTTVKRQVISIHSHVLHGCVGNSAVVLPLQLLGHTVEPLNTTQYLSPFQHIGSEVEPEKLQSLLEELPKLWKESDEPYLLSGYIVNPSVLYHVKNFYMKAIKTRGATDRFRWICDPVMGDNQKLYVPTSMVQGYRDLVTPFADILTPNQYELELLCEQPITSLQKAIGACKLLHQRGTRAIVVTSLQKLPEYPNSVLLLGSLCTKKQPTLTETFTFEFPYRNIYMAGTGDLFTAFLIDGLDRFGQNLKKACYFALETTQVIIRETIQSNPSAKTVDLLSSVNVMLGLRNPTRLPMTLTFDHIRTLGDPDLCFFDASKKKT